ncbi:hypothetical protein F4814DRAFT_449927 [Daldinia grandis]|nr:hypothetical protein F4814DRAFT_449927 [Daldinia grandis]
MLPYLFSSYQDITVLFYNRRDMDTIYSYPSPDVAAAMEASVACQVNIMAGIMGIMGLCWILLAAFFLYNFYGPLKITNTENSIDLHVVEDRSEKKWWIDDYDVV